MTNDEVLEQEWRWQDGRGIVHILEPFDEATIREMFSVRRWRPACGYQRKSYSRGQSALAATCLWCIAERSK